MNKFVVLIAALMILGGQIGLDIIAQESHDIPRKEREAIIERCRVGFAEHGSSMVMACAHQDMEAYRILQAYSPEYDSFVQRCMQQFSEHGWSMVVACAHQDIEAEKALSRMLEGEDRR